MYAGCWERVVLASKYSSFWGLPAGINLLGMGEKYFALQPFTKIILLLLGWAKNISLPTSFHENHFAAFGEGRKIFRARHSFIKDISRPTSYYERYFIRDEPNDTVHLFLLPYQPIYHPHPIQCSRHDSTGVACSFSAGIQSHYFGMLQGLFISWNGNR